MTKLSTVTLMASLLALAIPQIAHASGNDQNMPGLTSTAAKAPAQEDDLDAQIAAEEARQKQLADDEKCRKLEALKAANDKKQQKLTVGQKVGRETDRVLGQAANQTDRLAGHLRRKKF